MASFRLNRDASVQRLALHAGFRAPSCVVEIQQPVAGVAPQPWSTSLCRCAPSNELTKPSPTRTPASDSPMAFITGQYGAEACSLASWYCLLCTEPWAYSRRLGSAASQLERPKRFRTIVSRTIVSSIPVASDPLLLAQGVALPELFGRVHRP